MFNSDVNIKSMGWTTIADLNNKLIIHVAVNVEKVEIDQSIKDPDGIPLVWLGGKYVTRVRRMTNEEFLKYIREEGLKMEIDMRVVHDKEKDVPGKEVKED